MNQLIKEIQNSNLHAINVEINSVFNGQKDKLPEVDKDYLSTHI